MFSDSHTHLYSEQFNDDRDAMVQRAIDAGVTHMYMPNVDSESITGMLQLAEKYPDNCFPMMGLHPCSVGLNVEDELVIAKEYLFSSKHSFVAVGEIGLDYYWDRTHEELQRDAFRRQIEWAKELNLPIVIHSRDSLHDTIAIVKEMKNERLRGIFHCFSGTLEQAKEIIAIGDFYLGIGGVVTFKKSGLDEMVKAISLDHIVLETDAPYLAPTPHRGKRNESAYTTLEAQKVADIKEVNIGVVAEITAANAKKVFGV